MHFEVVTQNGSSCRFEATNLACARNGGAHMRCRESSADRTSVKSLTSNIFCTSLQQPYIETDELMRDEYIFL